MAGDSICGGAGHLEIVQYMRSKGVIMEVRDKQGRTPFHYACQNGQTKVAKFLFIDCKCEKNAKDRMNVTPEVLAKISGHKEIIEILKQEQITPDEEESMQAVRSVFKFSPFHA